MAQKRGRLRSDHERCSCSVVVATPSLPVRGRRIVHLHGGPTVAGYTITIAPSDDEAGPQTTIRVDTASGSARITELTVRAVDGSGLSAQQLPALNLEQLIAAVTPSAQAAIVAPPTDTPVPSAPGADTSMPVVSQEAPTPTERPARAKKAGRKAAPRKAAGRTRQAKADAAAQ